MPAAKGNQYALKEEAARVAYPVNVRGTMEERRAWRRASAGRAWNEWAREVFNAASEVKK